MISPNLKGESDMLCHYILCIFVIEVKVSVVFNTDSLIRQNKLVIIILLKRYLSIISLSGLDIRQYAHTFSHQTLSY